MTRKTINIMIACILLLGSSGTAYYYYNQQKNEKIRLEFIKAKSQLDNKHYTLAFNTLKKLAENGYPDAQYELAKMYGNGQTTEQDYENELYYYWLEKAAKQDHTEAQFSLGVNLLTDKKLDYLEDKVGFTKSNKTYKNKKDYGNGIDWLTKASDSGNNKAQEVLADFVYRHGSEAVKIEKDLNKAIDLLEKSAKQGNNKAKISLYEIYSNGEAEQNLDKANEYLISAAISGDENANYILGEKSYKNKDYEKALSIFKDSAPNNKDAQFLLGEMYRQGLGTDKNNVIAAEWYKKAAENENEKAYFYLGLAYQNGNIGSKYNSWGWTYDYANAIKWYTKDAEEGSDAAQNNLANIYYGMGENNPHKNIAKALYWYKKAAEQGNKRSEYQLGIMYREGEGTPKDYTLAMDWFTKSADQNWIPAYVAIGLLYENGLGVKQNNTKAIEWYQKAANEGDDAGQVNLGFMYEKGKGVKQDLDKSISWYRKSANQGNTRAMKNIAQLYSDENTKVYDENKAIYWFTKLAEKGDAYYQFEMGLRYENGNGVEQNYAQAIEWYKKAAEQNHGGAWNNLGVLKERGYPIDMYIPGMTLFSPKSFFEKACKNGDQKGCENYKNTRFY